MLFTSQMPGVLATKDRHPFLRTGWMLPDPPQLNPNGYERLAPGVFVVHKTNAWPVTVFDIAHRLPYTEEGIEPIRRIFPFIEWHQRANCRDAVRADDIFFGLDDEDHPALPPRFFRAARKLCAECPVQHECLTQALGSPEIFGVWAGTTERQRRPLRARIKSGESVGNVVSTWLAR